MAGSIDRKESELKWAGVEDEDCETTIPRMEVMNKEEKWSRDGKTYSSMWFLLRATKVAVNDWISKNIRVSALGFLETENAKGREVTRV